MLAVCYGVRWFNKENIYRETEEEKHTRTQQTYNAETLRATKLNRCNEYMGTVCVCVRVQFAYMNVVVSPYC